LGRLPRRLDLRLAGWAPVGKFPTRRSAGFLEDVGDVVSHGVDGDAKGAGDAGIGTAELGQFEDAPFGGGEDIGAGRAADVRHG